MNVIPVRHRVEQIAPGVAMNKWLLLAALALPVAAWADMTPTQQRAVTGTAAGAGIGAIAGAIGGPLFD